MTASRFVHTLVVLDNLSTGFDWAISKGVPLVVGDTGDHTLVGQILHEHEIQSIIHFAASAIVPDSVKDPLGYHKNNTVNAAKIAGIKLREICG
jgi:UDP-glucose 4-epimerase